MKKIIVGKSIPNKVHLENRIKSGISNIELQLFGDEIDVKNILKTIYDVKGLNITSVHAPFSTNKLEVNIENLASNHHTELIYSTVFIANEIGRKKNQIIPVVIHTNIKIEDVFLYQESWATILNRLNQLLKYNKYISFAIENLIPLSNSVYPKTYNNFMFDNVKLVKYLREELCSDRIFTTFDVCHAVSTIRFLEKFKAEGATFEIPNLEYYFIQNKDLCRIFHLSDVKGLGLAKEDHGIVFSSQREKYLLEILALYDKYLTHADLVIEIQENDYESFDNLKHTFNYLKDYYDNK